MKKRYQNAFFAFGLVVLIVMVTQLDFRQVWEGVNHAGYWFLAVILLWGILYIANTYSWYLIIDSIGNEQHVCRRHHIGFWWLYKITVSGFALNYATPGGLMGGEPYRIMSLSPKIGTQRASSSVILYVGLELTAVLAVSCSCLCVTIMILHRRQLIWGELYLSESLTTLLLEFP